MKLFIRLFLVSCVYLSLTALPAIAGMPAARVGDPTSHGGVITGPGSPTVLIGGVKAARMADLVVCTATSGFPPVPHVGGEITNGSSTVFIGGMPAARVGDLVTEYGGPPSTITIGNPTVLIGN